MSDAVTLFDWLRAWPPEAVVRLLRARPDLASPPPQDTRVLATRAATRASVARACDGLDEFTLAVLSAAVLCGADTEPAAGADIAAWLGPDLPAHRHEEAVAALRELALLWGDDPYSVPSTVRDVTGPFPGGLAAPSEALDGVDVGTELSEVGDPERRLLDTLSAGPPVGSTRDAAHPVPIEQAGTPVQRLLARGLLARRDAQTVELPRQVALHLRGDRPLGTLRPDPPELATRTQRQSTLDTTAAGEAATLLRHVEHVLTDWSQSPPGVLRSGGIGVRELRRLAKECDTDERRIALLVELVVGAGLAGDDGSETAEWVPTTAADGWLAAPPAQRWATLAAAWLDLPRLPGLAGTRDDRDRPLAPLTGELYRPLAPNTRRRVLGELAELPRGTVLTDTSSLVDLLNWRNPRQSGALRDAVIDWTVREATALGVVALGGLSTPGRRLLERGAEGRTEAAEAMADAMPEPVNHVLVQADLTVVAPGPLEPELAASMSLVGDVESAGGATVYRVTESSVRRALDAGRTAAELHELFATHSATPVPQALTYLIDDVARRHGQLRGGVAGSFLRCADPALLREVLAHPGTRSLELRRISDDVVVSTAPLVDVLAVLRDHGFSPVAEGPEGQLLDLRPSGRRIPARSATRGRPAAPAAPSTERLHGMVDDVRAADRAAAAKRGAAVSALAGGGARSGLSTTLGALREAVRARNTVRIDLVDSRGTATKHLLAPERIGGGVLEGADPDSGEQRRYPLHLITTVSVVHD